MKAFILPFHVHVLIWWPGLLPKDTDVTCCSRTIAALLFSLHLWLSEIFHPQRKTDVTSYNAVGWETAISICILRLFSKVGMHGLGMRAHMMSCEPPAWCVRAGFGFTPFLLPSIEERKEKKNNSSLGFSKLYVHPSNRDCPSVKTNRSSKTTQNAHASLKDLTVPSSWDESSLHKLKKKSI